MAFRPAPDNELKIGDRIYRVAEHPAAPGMAYGQTGRRGTVYQLIDDEGETWALKVFQRQYREPRLAGQAEFIRNYASIPGLHVCERKVLTSIQYMDLIREQMDLAYAVLMPWIPGKTWIEIIVGGEEWIAEQSLVIVKSFLQTLARMEETGIAHCDLSGPNVIITPDGEVELVDLEEMYSPNLVRPKALPGGSPGYAHRTAPQGLWRDDADRFAGAVLIVEMLGLCDHRLRGKLWGESYFNPDEMQTDCERYRLLKNNLGECWGESIVELFEAAWFSDTLSLCPTFTEWFAILPVEIPEQLSKRISVQQQNSVLNQQKLALLIIQAQEAAIAGSKDLALELYQRAASEAKGELLEAIERQISSLVVTGVLEKLPEREGEWQCEVCGRWTSIHQNTCPYCEVGVREQTPMVYDSEEEGSPYSSIDSEQSLVNMQRKEIRFSLPQGVSLVMIKVEEGKFLFGCNREVDKMAAANEANQRREYLSNFWIGKYPVTNIQYKIFVDAMHHSLPDHWTEGNIPFGQEDHPVVNIDHDDAMMFCQWLSNLTGNKFRIPSELEWEKAARGNDGRIWPWGNQEPDENLCNCASWIGGTTPVGAYSPAGDSPCGCADMAGNVWEWVISCLNFEENKLSNPKIKGTVILCGGAWNYNKWSSRSVARIYYPRKLSNAGFRCACDTLGEN
jgi:formylglycine-generating enzyme required for sulfatase activity